MAVGAKRLDVDLSKDLSIFWAELIGREVFGRGSNDEEQ